MNQILIQKSIAIQKMKQTQIQNEKKQQKKKQYQIQLIVSSVIVIIILFLFLFQWYQNNQLRKISEQLLNNYNITALYGTNEIVNIARTSNEQTTFNPFVVGMIKIDKIKLNYPILSQSSRELLKISLCRFAGPMPNEIGNLCIAGHNLVDNHFFSFLHELEKGDLISIFDLSGTEVIYEVYEKYEVSPNDLSCTSQDVGKNRIITLVTCNNVNGKRLVLKAKEN